MEEDESPPQLKGVVIITLPPPNNPSLGKTITAFTLSETPPPAPSPPLQQPQLAYNQQPEQLPQIQPPQSPQPQFSSRGFLFWSPKIILGLLSFSVFALILRSMTSSSTFLELNNSSDERKPSSFIFPLYPKLGVRDMSQRDLELKLGRFVERDLAAVVGGMDDEMNSHKITKFAPSVSAMDSSTFFTVRGNVYPDGLYYTSMLVGSPPRPYFLDIDTGSDLTWIQCDAPCTSCAKGPHSLYKPTRGKIVHSKDSMCKEVQRNQKAEDCETCQQCDYEIAYADHSSSMGVLSKDHFHLTMANGSLIKQNVVFGCGYDQQGLLLDSLARTDGILGLSRAKVSLPFQLASQGIINNVVGHCLAIDAGGGGYMFLGDDSVPYWGMAWVPMLNTPSMSVKEFMQSLKPLTLQFGSTWWVIPTRLQIPPEAYLIISNIGNVCLGILDGTNVHDGSTIIIGDISLRGKLVVYDNVNQKIGWARSNCLKPQRFKGSSFF